MNLKLEGWNVPDKESFVKLLIREAHANFYAVVEDGRATKEDYWSYLNDLNEYSKHFLGVDIDGQNNECDCNCCQEREWRRKHPMESIRQMFQESLKKNPLTPESIAEMFPPDTDKRYYEMFMKIYERQQERKKNG